MRLIFRRLGTGPLVDFSIFLPKGRSSPSLFSCGLKLLQSLHTTVTLSRAILT